MSTNEQAKGTDWLNAFLPIGTTEGDSWIPCGGGVLLLDRPVVWLVTSQKVVDNAGEQHLSVWVPKGDGAALLDLTDSQQQSNVGWIHHPSGISATLFPLDERFALKAFSEAQCSKVRTIEPLQPTASIGCIYGAGMTSTPYPTPAVCDGTIASVDKRSGIMLSTSPLLPDNVGAPLLLASPYGGAVTVAGILLGNTMISESDPRIMPVRLSRAICIDAALQLIRGEEANAQRQRVTTPTATTEPTAAAPTMEQPKTDAEQDS